MYSLAFGRLFAITHDALRAAREFTSKRYAGISNKSGVANGSPGAYSGRRIPLPGVGFGRFREPAFGKDALDPVALRQFPQRLLSDPGHRGVRALLAPARLVPIPPVALCASPIIIAHASKSHTLAYLADLNNTTRSLFSQKPSGKPCHA
jgi:hypothetical protein